MESSKICRSRNRPGRDLLVRPGTRCPGSTIGRRGRLVPLDWLSRTVARSGGTPQRGYATAPRGGGHGLRNSRPCRIRRSARTGTQVGLTSSGQPRPDRA
jgi:hypothetical protein